jgi:cyanophycinase
VIVKHVLSVLLLLSFVPGLLHSQGSILLVGGGRENYNDWSDTPYRWLVTHAPNRKIAVLHYSDTETWFSGYFPWLSPCTVSNRQITSTVQANDSATYRFILQHDGIFLRGGDQAQYVRLWKGTLTQQAIREVFQRGGVVGGTSAGEMVLSDVAYTSGTSDNGALLRAPTSPITLVDDFLGMVTGILAESHTSERGRLGRLPVFIARYKEANEREVAGIGVDANTALAIGPDGVGEVMGGSAVSFLRWKSGTSYLIESGRPFSLRNMMFDQLLPGFKIDLRGGAIQLSSTATAFVPKQVSFPRGPLILDGSGNSADWSAASGSLKKLQGSLAHPTDTIGIFSSSSAPASANTVSSILTAWGVPTRILWVNEQQKNDPVVMAAGASCGAFVFAGCTPDSLSRFLDSATTMGRMFVTKVAVGIPLLFLSEDVMLAGEKALGGIYSSSYSAYYGTLTQLPGLNILKGVQPISRFYQNMDNTVGYDYSETRIMGMFWSMGKSQLPYGLLIDAGTYVTIANGMLQAGGTSATATPAILVDARGAQTVDFPLFHRPGKPNAVNNAAIIGALMHVIRPGDTFEIITDVEQGHSLLPEEFRLDPCYPNPFNPSTTIRFSTPHSGVVSVRVFDLLGREVAELLEQQVEPGTHETRWEASRNASGMYLVRLDQVVKGSVKSQTSKLVLAK